MRVKNKMAKQLSPLIFIGIGIFILPVIFNFIHWQLPSWTNTLGIFVLVLGLMHTVFGGSD
jgi:hypothetical protein